MDEDEEVIVKAMTDYWVVGKKSDQRELYVILNQKNANLIEVNGRSDTTTMTPDMHYITHPIVMQCGQFLFFYCYQTTQSASSSRTFLLICLFPSFFSLARPTVEEVKRLCATQFNNIFFLD